MLRARYAIMENRFICQFGVAPPASWMATEKSTLRLATTAQGAGASSPKMAQAANLRKSTRLLFLKPQKANQAQLNERAAARRWIKR